MKEIEELKEEEMEESINLIEEYIVSEYIRETHAVRAKEYIAKDWGGKITYGDTDLTSDLANICFSHNEDYKYVLQLEHLKLCGYNTYACIPFIATLLRLADIIDFDPKRAPRILFEHLSIRNAVSVQEWKNIWLLARGLLQRSHLYMQQNVNIQQLNYQLDIFVI